jgi:hypothetical protein
VCVCVCVCVCFLCVSNCVRSGNLKKTASAVAPDRKKFYTLYYAIFDVLSEDDKTAFFCQQETTSFHTTNSSMSCLQSGN